jgi:hypothetical protein
MSIIATSLPMTSPAPAGAGAHSWKPLLKALSVLVGYSGALCAACLAVYIQDLNTQGTDAQASPGMYAFGDSLLFGAVLGFGALFPTGLGLYFLRPVRTFWTLLAIAALALAATGPVCAIGYECLRHLERLPALVEVCMLFGMLRLLGSPLLAAGFLLGACLAPTRFARWALLSATAIEGVVAVLGAINWYIVPSLR